MKLSELEKNTKSIVVAINAQSSLKKRLASMGVNVDKTIEVLETSLQKNTIKISVGMGSLALRLDEAKCIDVEKIA